jgi:protein-disulfide isomerase
MVIPHNLKQKSATSVINAALLQSLLISSSILVCGLIAVAQKADIVATVDGREIRRSEVDGQLLAQIMPLEQQLYAIRKAALENLVIMALLESEAAKRGVSLEELRKALTTSNEIVKATEVEDALAENLAAFGSMSRDEAKERLRLDLETQKRLANYKQVVAELRQKAAVKIYLEEPRWPLALSLKKAPVLGGNNVPVTIFEFADFQCPYCRESQRILKQLLKDHGQDVKLVFKHLPLDIHTQAFAAARAAFCAGEQDRFWEYHDALFTTSSLDTTVLQRTARSLKLDLQAFDACLTSDQSLDAINRDRREAAYLGISSTPTFFVNGKMLQGVIGLDGFRSLIEQELNIARSESPSSASSSSDLRRKK